jgi:hypothetical protein
LQNQWLHIWLCDSWHVRRWVMQKAKRGEDKWWEKRMWYWLPCDVFVNWRSFMIDTKTRQRA